MNEMLEPEPITFKLLLTKLSDQDILIEWCMNVGLIANRYECCKCGDNMKLYKRTDVIDGFSWRCQKFGENKHDVRRRLRKGTWFDESTLSMSEILILTHMWCVQLSNQSIKCELGVSPTTIVNWKSFCRDVCVELCMMDNEQLGGIGLIVEIAENKFGSRKSHREMRVDGTWVFGGVERGTDKCFVTVVRERCKSELLKVIKQYIKPGTTIISDIWKSYNCSKDEDFVELAKNSLLNFKEPVGGADTNSIRGTWSAIKRNIGQNHCTDQFDSYLFEYMWRRKNKHADMTRRFLECVKLIYPPAIHD